MNWELQHCMQQELFWKIKYVLYQKFSPISKYIKQKDFWLHFLLSYYLLQKELIYYPSECNVQLETNEVCAVYIFSQYTKKLKQL